MFSLDQDHKCIHCLHAKVPVPPWLTQDYCYPLELHMMIRLVALERMRGFVVETWLALQ
jgi:hypothetical protein